jgi:hypothetical protein
VTVIARPTSPAPGEAHRQTDLPGRRICSRCGPLMAAKIIAETAGVCRSKGKAAAFARADGFNKCEMAGPPTSRSRRFRDRTADLPLSVTWSPGTPGMRENPLWSLAEVDHSWRSEGLLQFGEPIAVLRIVATITRVRLYFHPIAVPAGERSL